jgi:hypothetical protein
MILGVGRIVGFVFGQKGAMAAATIEGAKFTKLAR